MAIQPAEKLYTADDYFAMTGEYPRYELLEGGLVEPFLTVQGIQGNASPCPRV